MLRDGQPLDSAAGPDVTELLTAAALCNDAALRPPADGQGWAAVGDPTEAALLTAATRLGLQTGQLTAAMPRASKIPFDSDRKRMTTVHRRPPEGAGDLQGSPGGPCSIRRCCAMIPAPWPGPRERAGGLARDGFRGPPWPRPTGPRSLT